MARHSAKEKAEMAELQQNWIATCAKLRVLISQLSGIHSIVGIEALKDPGVAYLLTAFEREQKVKQYLHALIGTTKVVPPEDAENAKLALKEREERFRQKLRRLAAKEVDHWRDGVLKKIVLAVPPSIARTWANRIEFPTGNGKPAAISDDGTDKRLTLGGSHAL